MPEYSYYEVNRNGDIVGEQRLERGEVLQAGYVTYTGRVLSAEQCERVNLLTRKIVVSAQATATVSSNLLNMRHREFLGAASGWEH